MGVAREAFRVRQDDPVPEVTEKVHQFNVDEYRAPKQAPKTPPTPSSPWMIRRDVTKRPHSNVPLDEADQLPPQVL